MSTPVEITWLLAAVSKGDAAAFERLYAASCAKVYGVVLRIVRRPDLAAEVMEEAYLEIWRRAGEFDPAHVDARWPGWSAIARGRAIDVVAQAAGWKRRARAGPTEDEGPGHRAAAPVDR